MPFTRSWTLLQKALITSGTIVILTFCVFGIYSYERYYRGPDDSFFVGSWQGDYVPTTLYMGPPDIAFHFKPDHTYEGSEGAGRWHAGGDFLYLRLRQDDASEPYDRLQMWHIDSMSSDEVDLSQFGARAILKRRD